KWIGWLKINSEFGDCVNSLYRQFLAVFFV
ncbi:MAG: hypothetical protein ACI9DQ_001709, partial [Glaciecola sp.]